MMSMAKGFSMEKPWSLDEFLLPEDHPAVQAELTRKTNAGSPGNGENWKQKHKDFEEKRGCMEFVATTTRNFGQPMDPSADSPGKGDAGVRSDGGRTKTVQFVWEEDERGK